MEDSFKFADDIGPVKVIHVYEPTIQLKAVLVVDNVAAGPSIGGIRMAPDVTAEECFRLARAMTMKNAAAGLPHGGGKVVLYGDPNMPLDKKEILIRGLANALRDIKEYVLAPDMGTNELCMGWIYDEVQRVVGLPRELGGIPLDEIGATGWGLANSAKVAADYVEGLKLTGARVVIQGYGAVGRHAAHFLSDMGAIIVGVADSRGAVHDPNGLDLKRLDALKREKRGVADLGVGKRLSAEDVIGIECDIWIPAARPDVINIQNVERLKTKLVLQGANIPATPEAEKRLYEKGIAYVPDFIANAGGVICAAMEYHGSTQALAMSAIQEKITENTRTVLEDSGREKIPPRDAAVRLALKRVRRAMEMRRWGAISQSRPELR